MSIMRPMHLWIPSAVAVAAIVISVYLTS